jgi:peptidylprolyl isomerase
VPPVAARRECHAPLPLTAGVGGALARRPFVISASAIATRKKTNMSTENTLILDTTKGPVTIEMRPDLAPQHVARIKELVREGFYDGIVFHRVIDGFMAQTGCPQGTGTGGSGKKLKAEFSREPHVRGVVSMARAQSPDSGDSQFFICFDDASFLDGKYSVWGKVTSGMENVDKIKRGEPVANPDKIVKARMAADAPA